ncbi:MAG: circadian clock KaiB family protein [Ginsengibacter sp.]
MSKKVGQISLENIQANGTDVETYTLRLFVTGVLPNSRRAVVNIKKICEEYLKDRYELDIVDIYQQPELALTENIIAVPMLIKKFPLPEIRLIGDLSDTESVLEGLNLI